MIMILAFNERLFDSWIHFPEANVKAELALARTWHCCHIVFDLTKLKIPLTINFIDYKVKIIFSINNFRNVAEQGLNT